MNLMTFESHCSVGRTKLKTDFFLNQLLLGRVQTTYVWVLLIKLHIISYQFLLKKHALIMIYFKCCDSCEGWQLCIVSFTCTNMHAGQ